MAYLAPWAEIPERVHGRVPEWLELKQSALWGPYWYCNMCNRWAEPSHIDSEPHNRRKDWHPLAARYRRRALQILNGQQADDELEQPHQPLQEEQGQQPRQRVQVEQEQPAPVTGPVDREPPPPPPYIDPQALINAQQALIDGLRREVQELRQRLGELLGAHQRLESQVTWLLSTTSTRDEWDW